MLGLRNLASMRVDEDAGAAASFGPDGRPEWVGRTLVDADGRPLPHFARVACFGWPFTSNWVRIAYDPSLSERFHVGVRELRAPPS